MRESKLYYYLSKLTPKHRKAFRDFLASPYFCKKPEPKALFEVIDKRLLGYKLRTLSNEQAYAAVFPQQAYDKAVMRKLMNRLLDLLMEFLAHEQLHHDPGLRLLTAQKSVTAMGANRYFDFFHKKTRDLLNENNLEYFERAYRSEMHLAELLAAKSVRAPIPNLGKIADLIREGYTVRMLNLGASVLVQSRVHGSSGEIKGFDDLLTDLGQDIENRPILVQMLYRKYMTIAFQDEPAHYHQLRDLLDQYSQDIDHDLAGELYTGILSFCIYRVNAGESEFLAELLNIYQAMLDEGHILRDRFIHPNRFKNMLVVAARAGAFDWANWFMEEYGPRIGPNEVGNALAYNRAVLDYFQQNIAAAEKGFSSILRDMKDIYYGIDARVYLLRIYYETANLDGMDSLCHSFRIFLIRSKKLSDARKENYLIFVSLYRRLVNVPPRDRERLEKLRDDVMSLAKIAPRTWLLDKIDYFLNDLSPSYR